MRTTHRQIAVVGHRGAAGDAPENTLGSFALAVEQGADAVELDVHLSKDGSIVVCHDAKVNRTTTGRGAIAELLTRELKQLDAGMWHSDRYAGERLPLLEEVFDLLPPAVGVNVEMKVDSPELRDGLLRLLRERSMLERVFVSSFHHGGLTRMKQEEPGLRIGLLVDKKPIMPEEAMRKYGVELYSMHPHHKLVNRQWMEQANRLGIRVYPWTVNKVPRMAELIALGVSGIITDFPARLRALLNN
ncbi:glycerophosphodiester phosphodiesterase family protein [Paenibacillus sp. GYB004]|uniref:glycerophosphodiester phosphodiesterase n=1 Tax=Paenibacillus sp. GYB004 TaxID=2994393 RepID=UPI002F96CB7B